VHNGWVRSKAQRARLRYSGTDDAVKEQWNRCRGRRCCDGGCCEHLKNVDAEEETTMTGEVVVDGEACLRVERLMRGRLHNNSSSRLFVARPTFHGITISSHMCLVACLFTIVAKLIHI